MYTRAERILQARGRNKMQTLKLRDSLTPVLVETEGNTTKVYSVGPDIVSKMLARGWQCGPWKDINGGKMQVWYRPGKDSNDV